LRKASVAHRSRIARAAALDSLFCFAARGLRVKVSATVLEVGDFRIS